ncbi:MAG: hypothetical protein P4L22_01055 [Candidatus Babeliales bacterium]|nr:hypothetical protein [Candidatus Babeliales bacterium]
MKKIISLFFVVLIFFNISSSESMLVIHSRDYPNIIRLLDHDPDITFVEKDGRIELNKFAGILYELFYHAKNIKYPKDFDHDKYYSELSKIAKVIIKSPIRSDARQKLEALCMASLLTSQ